MRLVSIAAMLNAHLAASARAQVQVQPQVSTSFGLVVATFSLPEGVVTAYLPDDVAAGEVFSGTLEGPGGFVLAYGGQRSRSGETFRWTVPSDETPGRSPLILLDEQGSERARVSFRVRDAAPQETAFRFPALIQTGRPFPIRGPFDGDSRTTSITVGDVTMPPLAESVRKAIVRAPGHLLGPTPATLTKAGVTRRHELRSLSIEISAPTERASDTSRQLTVRGLAGITQDVPLQVAGEYVYLRSSDIPTSGSFSVRRDFSSSQRGAEAVLVVPQSLHDEVAVVLRTSQRNPDVDVRRQHGDGLKSLDFDALAVAGELLFDAKLGNAAAYAMLAADERRALPIIFSSIPESGIHIQFIGFLWFLDHFESRQYAAGEAHEAALRVLSRILSTATAQLAIFVVGVTGSAGDVPLLERFYGNGRTGAGGLRDASRAALVRLGSRKHLEELRAELATPLPPDATYGQGLRLSEVLRTAAIAGHADLIPVVCGHVADPVVVEIDIYAYPGRSAADTLSALVDGATPLKASARSLDQWKAYCGEIRTQPLPERR